MFMSKVSYNPSNLKSLVNRRLSNDVYSSHQELWKLFSDRSERDFVYREELDLCGRPFYYVLSKSSPRQMDGYKVETKPFAPEFSKGDILQFNCRLNPLISIRGEGTKSKKHDVMMHAKYLSKKNGVREDDMSSVMQKSAVDWLMNSERASRMGVKFNFPPNVERYQQHSVFKRSGENIRFSTVDYSGVLTIEDPDLFIKSLHSGIGSSKAFGCGMIMIKRISS